MSLKYEQSMSLKYEPANRMLSLGREGLKRLYMWKWPEADEPDS